MNVRRLTHPSRKAPARLARSVLCLLRGRPEAVIVQGYSSDPQTKDPRTVGYFAPAKRDRSHVRFGSKADDLAVGLDVRFRAKCGCARKGAQLPCFRRKRRRRGCNVTAAAFLILGAR